MNVKKISHDHSSFPSKLKNIASSPKEIFVKGNLIDFDIKPVVSVVGSRSVTPYGKQVATKLTSELASRGIAVVSGLAIGTDGLAHHAALEAGGYTVAVLPTPVNSVYPASNRNLADKILSSGGALLSEYSKDDRSEAFKSRFVARNRIVSALADVLLITEASEKSGTMHTANFALEQGKTVMAVPGNITSPNSRGTNNLIKAGAIPVTDISDILSQLGIADNKNNDTVLAANNEEQAILDQLLRGVTDSSELQALSGLDAGLFSQTLTMLEISGKIRPLGAGHWTIT